VRGPHVGEEPRRAASCRTSGFLPPWSRQSLDRTLNLPQRGRQVLGADLNRSESRRGRCRALPPSCLLRRGVNVLALAIQDREQ
jgi:hypothetical protein